MDINYDEVEKLVSYGLTNQDVANAIGISEKTFYNLKNRDTDFTDSIKKGKNELKQMVATSLLEKATQERDTTALIFLAKRLNIFKNDLALKTQMVDGKTSLQALSEVIGADIPIEDKRAYIEMITSFNKAYEFAELEDRIKGIEDELEK